MTLVHRMSKISIHMQRQAHIVQAGLVIYSNPFFFFGWVLRHTNTVEVIWGLSSFTSGGRPQVPFHALFQAQVGT